MRRLGAVNQGLRQIIVSGEVSEIHQEHNTYNPTKKNAEQLTSDEFFVGDVAAARGITRGGFEGKSKGQSMLMTGARVGARTDFCMSLSAAEKYT